MLKKLQNKLIQSKIKNLPQDQQDMIMAMMEKDPKLFEKIAKETKELQKSGMEEQLAAMQVMMKYRGEIQKLLMK